MSHEEEEEMKEPQCPNRSTMIRMDHILAKTDDSRMLEDRDGRLLQFYGASPSLAVIQSETVMMKRNRDPPIGTKGKKTKIA
eukprot:scaffold1087_cov136-Cylindrotheca_fusiformis.AAC.17